MSHEIRTPLNAIVGFSELLQSTDNDADKKEFIKRINVNSEQLLRLINDILELSRMDADIFKIKPVHVNFAHSFDDICIILKERVTNPNVKYILENPYSVFDTYIDFSRINQIITNFVINASKYTSKGHIKVGYDYVDSGLRIYCEDTGSGIPQDKCDKIFDRFYKLNEFVQGTGLGLSICQSITERLGGKIGVESELGSGSIFWVWIPCCVDCKVVA